MKHTIHKWGSNILSTQEGLGPPNSLVGPNAELFPKMNFYGPPNDDDNDDAAKTYNDGNAYATKTQDDDNDDAIKTYACATLQEADCQL